MVSPKFVNDRIKLRQATGGLAPKRQGHRGWGKLAGFGDWAKALPSARPDLTLDQIREELAAAHDLCVHRASVGNWLHRLGLSHKKNVACQRNRAA